MKDHYDVVIVGSGIAGLYTAINISKDIDILILSKRDLNISNSTLAQGGIAAVVDEKNDSKIEHVNDSLVAGGFKNNIEALNILVDKGPDEIKSIIDMGVNFDKTIDGDPHLTLEGGHSNRRILHHKDKTGKEIIDKLLKKVLTLKNVKIVENTSVSDISKKYDYFYIELLENNNNKILISSNFCVLATGGIGEVFEYTTNSKISTGDGIYFAGKLGAQIKNVSSIQFHPTAFKNGNKSRCFLISEAVRGEGGFLLNCKFERFMHKYNEKLELAPRDIISKSIIAESKIIKSNKFYIDISHKDANFIKLRFPSIYKHLLKYNFDLTKDKIPIFPCQHYLMGGIDVDINSLSSVKNLYAVGECSHTGVHGNNRLASNSLLEGLVFSKNAADHINEIFSKENFTDKQIEKFYKKSSISTPDLFVDQYLKQEIKSIMQKSVFVELNKLVLIENFNKIKSIKEMLDKGSIHTTYDFINIRSLANVAYLILEEVIKFESN